MTLRTRLTDRLGIVRQIVREAEDLLRNKAPSVLTSP